MALCFAADGETSAPARSEAVEAIVQLAELAVINLEGCVGFAALPASAAKMVCLRELNLINCHALDEESLEALPKVVNSMLRDNAGANFVS